MPPSKEIMTWFSYSVVFLCFYAVNKQLNDKERVAAALENPNLLDMVDECLAPSFGWIMLYVHAKQLDE
jgi:hypothetical protein